MKRLAIALISCIVVTLAPETGAQAQSSFGLQNRWKPAEYIHVQNGVPASTSINPAWQSAQWIAVPVQGTSFIYLQNRQRAGQYLHIQTGGLQLSAISPNWWSAMWALETVDGSGAVRIRNRWQPHVFIHNQNGNLSAGPAGAGWWSAMWIARPIIRSPQGDRISSDTVLDVAKSVYGTAEGVKDLRDQYRDSRKQARQSAQPGHRTTQPKTGRLDSVKQKGKSYGKTVLMNPPTEVPFSQGLKVAEVGGDICWKDSYGRGVGTIPRGCGPNEDNDGLLCYPKCPPGWKGAATMCIPSCPPGFTDTGLHCLKGKPYGRGAGYPWKFGDKAFSLDGARARCRRDSPQGCEKMGEIIYPKCKPGYRRIGCCICSPQCPPGMIDIGISCQKNTYDRGVGKLRNCATYEERDAGLCYPRCRPGFDGIGPVCWAQRCPAKFPVNCGASCAVSRNACIQSVTSQVLSPLEVVTNIAGLVLTGGAANAAKTAASTAAKTAAKVGTKAATRAAIKASLRRQARAMGKELSESALDNAAETMYEASQTGEFDFAALDPTGIASVVVAFAKPLCADVK